QLQWCDDEEARAAVHLPVVEEYRPFGKPAAAQAHGAVMLLSRGVRRRRERSAVHGWLRHALLDQRVQRALLLCAVELPQAEPSGDGRAEQCTEQDDEPARNPHE